MSFQLSGDPHAFVADNKGRDIDAIVEQVRDGTQMRVRLLLDEHTHQFVNLVLAGAKSPRASSAREGEAGSAEPYGEEAKFFTEVRLLQRPIKIRLLSAQAPMSSMAGPIPAAAAGKTNGFGLPAPAPASQTTSATIIGSALHPNGNIAEFLCAAGLAKVIDWHAGILAPEGGLEKFRQAEKAARDKRLGLWASSAPVASTSNGVANGHAPAPASTTKGNSFDATVVRVWNAEQLSILPKIDEKSAERRVQLASVRGPKGNDSKNVHWANEAKESVLPPIAQW